MNVLLTMSYYATLMSLPNGPTDPFMPDKNSGVPKGFAGVGSMISFIVGAMIFVFMGVAVIGIVWSIGRAIFSDRHEIKDAKTPLLAFLVLGVLGTLLELFFGIWSAVINSA